MIIDAHTHLLNHGFWPNEWFDHVAKEWAKQGESRKPEDVRGRIEDGLADPGAHQMIEAMDKAGVDRAVLLPMDWGPTFTYGQPIGVYQQDTLDAAARYPNRLIPFGGIDPRRPEAAETIGELLRTGQIAGLKLYPSAGWEPMMREAQPLYDLCSRAGVPVLFHTGDPLPILDYPLGGPALLDRVAAEYPDLKILAGHAGAPRQWQEAADLARAHSNVLLEMSVWIWADTPIERAREVVSMMARLRDEIGAHRFVFGTDHVSGRRVRGTSAMADVLGLFRAANDQLDGAAHWLESDVNLFLGGTLASVLGDWLSRH
jgi:predicted TIM-barrel fold metal-dependent hydrolase